MSAVSHMLHAGGEDPRRHRLHASCAHALRSRGCFIIIDGSHGDRAERDNRGRGAERDNRGRGAERDNRGRGTAAAARSARCCWYPPLEAAMLPVRQVAVVAWFRVPTGTQTFGSQRSYANFSQKVMVGRWNRHRPSHQTVFLRSRVFHPPTHAHVRLIGPCF